MVARLRRRPPQVVETDDVVAAQHRRCAMAREGHHGVGVVAAVDQVLDAAAAKVVHQTVQRKAAGGRAAPGVRPRVPQSGRTALGGVPDPVAGVTTPEHHCLRRRKGGIQAQGRGWTPSIWEMSVEASQELL